VSESVLLIYFNSTSTRYLGESEGLKVAFFLSHQPALSQYNDKLSLNMINGNLASYWPLLSRCLM
jgi:hypothetical protein